MEPVICREVPLELSAAEAALREALASRGFGILTEVDVTATLRQKLGIETRPYRILGACNPALAHESLGLEPRVGAFLPCGISLYEGNSKGETIICLQNPEMISQSFTNPALEPIARQARERLEDAVRQVAENAVAAT